jgi:hypothetical protein
VKALKKWEDLEELLSEGLLSEKDLNEMIAKSRGDASKAKANDDLSVEEFGRLVNLIDEATDDESLTEDEDDDADEEEEEEDENDEEILLEVFDELKNKKTGKLDVKTFMAWDEIQEAIKSGDLTEQEVKKALSEAGVKGSQQMTFEQFRKSLDILEDLMDDGDDNGDVVDTEGTAMTVEAKRGEEKDREDDDEDDEDEDAMEAEMVKEIYDELKGKVSKIVPCLYVYCVWLVDCFVCCVLCMGCLLVHVHEL